MALSRVLTRSGQRAYSVSLNTPMRVTSTLRTGAGTRMAELLTVFASLLIQASAAGQMLPEISSMGSLLRAE